MPLARQPFTLRPATAADYRCLWELKRLTMRPYVEQTWGNWDDRAQEHHFRRSYRAATVQVISLADRPAGLLHTEREPDALFLANLQIHPDFQNNGLGAAVLRSVVEAADALGLPIRLQVLRVNTSALRFYRRFGFSAHLETSAYVQMRRPPGPEK